MKVLAFMGLVAVGMCSSDRCVTSVGVDFADGPLLYSTLSPFSADEEGYVERPPHQQLYPQPGDQVEVISAPTDFITLGDPYHKWRYAQVKVVSGVAKGSTGWAAMERDDDLWLFKPSKACLYTLWQAPKSVQIKVEIKAHITAATRPSTTSSINAPKFSHLFNVFGFFLFIGGLVLLLQPREQGIAFVIESEDSDFEEPLLQLVEV